ncbi:MAG TPA: hypothetical protein VK358_05105, partial [Longimicrobium sp.]|nr:hypothetical protein [Longimicrobium sp.]
MAEAAVHAPPREGGAGVPLERLTRFSYDRTGVTVFTALFVGTALGAYAFGPVPVQWLAQLLAIGAAGFLLLNRRLAPVPGLTPVVWLLGWALVVTFANAMWRNYAGLMPQLASSPYPVYVGLRFLNLLAFAAAAALTFWVLERGHRELVLRRIVWVGSVLAVAGIYIYFAQVNGWWEPGRTRLGTSGDAQATAFAYVFHRAMGTFREPSHFAEWLLMPFLLSFSFRGRGKRLHIAVLAVALLLTGSLTGIVVGVLGGLAGALILGNPFGAGRVKLVARLGLAGALAMLAFNAVVVSQRDSANLFEIFRDRIMPVLNGGLGESNRGYVYAYAGSRPLPFLGSGLGHAQLEFSSDTGNAIVSSFLNLYLNTWLSLGVVGITLMVLLLALPAVRLARHPRYRTEPDLLMLMAAYVGWLLMYTVHSEELTLVFGILFGLVAWEGARRIAPRPSAETA